MLTGRVAVAGGGLRMTELSSALAVIVFFRNRIFFGWKLRRLRVDG